MIAVLIAWYFLLRRRDKALGPRLEEEKRLDDEEEQAWIDEWARKQKEKKDKKDKK